MPRKVTKRRACSCGWSANPRRMNMATDEPFQALAVDVFPMEEDKLQTWDPDNHPQDKWCQQIVIKCIRGRQIITVTCVSAKSLQLCLTLCDPLNCSLPGSSIRGIFQARILEWVAISSSGGSSWPRDYTCVSCVSCIPGRFFTGWAIREAHKELQQRITTENYNTENATILSLSLSLRSQMS